MIPRKLLDRANHFSVSTDYVELSFLSLSLSLSFARSTASEIPRANLAGVSLNSDEFQPSTRHNTVQLRRVFTDVLSISRLLKGYASERENRRRARRNPICRCSESHNLGSFFACERERPRLANPVEKLTTGIKEKDKPAEISFPISLLPTLSPLFLSLFSRRSSSYGTKSRNAMTRTYNFFRCLRFYRINAGREELFCRCYPSEVN